MIFFCIFCVFVLCFYLPSFWCRGNTRMSCCFVASCHSDKNLSNRLDYLSRLPFASLFIDNSWLITETVSNLQENQSSSWRRPRGCCHHAHLCSNAAHAFMLKCSNAQMLKCLCSNVQLYSNAAHVVHLCSRFCSNTHVARAANVTHADALMHGSNSCSCASHAHIRCS